MFLLIAQPTYANSSDRTSNINYIQTIETLIAEQRNSKGLLETKLTIDKLIDPNLDVFIAKAEISEMITDIRSMIKPSDTDWDKLNALRTYLYEAGAWNDFKPFSYDMDDPLGQSRESRLLHNYLDTRKGNCVSMPILHAILGQELGLDVSLSTAPLHMFVKYRNAAGETINIEATSGGHPARSVWYEKNLPMLPRAIENRVYMADLTSTESVAVVGHDLASHLHREGDFESSVIVSERLIKAFPNYAPLYLTRGSAYYKLFERDFKSVYPKPEDIPQGQIAVFERYMRQNAISFSRADDLGWADPDILLAERQNQSTGQ